MKWDELEMSFLGIGGAQLSLEKEGGGGGGEYDFSYKLEEAL